jgi:hypothetical protein
MAEGLDLPGARIPLDVEVMILDRTMMRICNQTTII